MRLIAVVMGTESEQARMNESRKLLQYGFRFFDTSKQLSAGETLQNTRIWQGEIDYVPVGVDNDVYLTLPGGQTNNLTMTYEINNMLTAPVVRGDKMGTVIWQLGDDVIEQRPLIALEAIERGSLMKRIMDTVRQYINSLKARVFG